MVGFDRPSTHEGLASAVKGNSDFEMVRTALYEAAKEEYETQAGRTEAPIARSPVAGTMELVKPLHAQWPSSDGPRVSR